MIKIDKPFRYCFKEFVDFLIAVCPSIDFGGFLLSLRNYCLYDLSIRILIFL